MKKDKVIKGLTISIIVMFVILIMTILFIKIELLKINVELIPGYTITEASSSGGVTENIIPERKIVIVEFGNVKLLTITKYEELQKAYGKYDLDWF